MNKTISLLKFLIGWPLAIVAIIFLIRLFLPQFIFIQARIFNANIPLLILSVILFLVYYFLRCYLWKAILQFKGHRMPLMQTAYLWEISEFKRYMPGNIWSFLSRVSLFENEGVEKKLVGLALLDEIQLIIISCALISIFCLPLILSSGESVQLLRQMQIIILGSAAVIIIYSLVVAFLFQKRGLGNFRANLFLPGYSLRQKIILTLISTVAFFIFGLATLVACLSVFTFEPKLFLELSAFFTFALLAGYLSFITPMGLGVREGIIILGLTKLTSIATAGFLSIFSRIVLIISELTFLAIVLGFEISTKIKNK
ncbi:MAG TPA: lysylphosphatidylglycerol synthase domain-containing protein [Patescibacteria group bacterium]|nr:lysylphosphatidylglycerol synthase domain-containing protein [Patescibacteria group bacterium]